MLNLTPSSYYYKAKEAPVTIQKQEADLRNRIEEIACEWTRYGYRRITAQLRREGHLVNHKKVLKDYASGFPSLRRKAQMDKNHRFKSPLSKISQSG